MLNFGGVYIYIYINIYLCAHYIRSKNHPNLVTTPGLACTTSSYWCWLGSILRPGCHHGGGEWEIFWWFWWWSWCNLDPVCTRLMHINIYLDPPFWCQISAAKKVCFWWFVSGPNFRPDWRIQAVKNGTLFFFCQIIATSHEFWVPKR